MNWAISRLYGARGFRNARGLTMMEMLVTLVLISFATMLMFQMLGSYRIANERVRERSGAIDRSVLFQAWFRDSVRGLYISNGLEFSGDADSFSGITLNPLYAQEGVPVPVAWRIVDTSDGSWMIYSEDGRERWRHRLAGTRRSYFYYLDTDGKQQRSWPPELGKRDPESLPAVVAFVREGADAPLSLAAAVLGPLKPVLRLTGEEEF